MLGMLWDRCDKFQSLPTTNKNALLQRLESQLQLVVDGMKELQQVVNYRIMKIIDFQACKLDSYKI